MKLVRIGLAVVFVGVICQAVAVGGAIPTKDYPIRVDTKDYGTHKKDVVIVLTAGGEYDLDSFMKSVVPSALRSNGALPEPAAVDTQLYKPVKIANAKRLYVLNRDALPVRLRVKANHRPNTSASQDSHERYRGSVSDPFTYQNYFITQYTAVAPVTKFRTQSTYLRSVTITVPSPHKQYRWVDP